MSKLTNHAKGKKGAQLAATQEQLEAMRTELDILRSRVHAAKVAYLNRTPFQDREISFDDLKAFATEYIRKNYAYQRARFGKLKVKMSVSKLLR